MKFLKEYKRYQLYKVDDIDITDLDNTGSSRLIKNDIMIFLPDTVIEIGNELNSFKNEEEAIEYIDNNTCIQEKFKNAIEKSEKENERQERLRYFKEDERRKYERKRMADYENEVSKN